MADTRKVLARRRKIQAIRDRARAASDELDRPLRAIALCAVALGVAIRLLLVVLAQPAPDGAEYIAMGRAWAQTHTFLLPYGDFTELSPDPAYSNHYPPAYPFYLGLVFSAFGAGLLQAKLAALLVSLVAVVVTYLATRDLYGDLPALLLTALVALEPHLLWIQGAGYSENMVLVFFVLTMWAIVRSLEDDRFILLAGLFAGLAYLTRASIGPFFLIAGVGGFLWRFYYRGWDVLRNPWYVAAIAIFGAIFLAWATRNLVLFGWPHWETSSYLTGITGYAVEHPGALVWALAAKLPLFALFLLFYVWPFFSEARGSLARIRDEDVSALWLSIGLLWLLGWIMTSIFWVWERRPLWWLDNHRYVVLGLVPLAWALLRDARPSQATLSKIVALLLGFLLVGVPSLASDRNPDVAAARWLEPHLHQGDAIAMVGGKYSYAAFLQGTPAVRFFEIGHAPENRTADWVVSAATFPGSGNYTVAASFRQTNSFEPDSISRVWVRTDLARERGVPTNVTVRLGFWPGSSS